MQPSDHIAHEDFEDVFVAFMAVIFGAFGVGQASSFAPNYAKAKLSANRIYALVDRKPEIDGYSEDGLKPVSESYFIFYAFVLLRLIVFFRRNLKHKLK